MEYHTYLKIHKYSYVIYTFENLKWKIGKYVTEKNNKDF